MDAENWIENFKGFSEEDQIKIASAVAGVLTTNEDVPTREYDIITSRSLRFIFDSIIASFDDTQKARDFKTLFERFNQLNEERQVSALKEFEGVIERNIRIQAEEEAKKQCEKEDHIFNGWRLAIVNQFNGEISIAIPEWRRACKRCGFVETLKEEPKEVKRKRLRKEYNDIIDKAKAGLKALEEE